MIPFLKVKGIRQRWLLNSISILVMILVVVVAAFSLNRLRVRAYAVESRASGRRRWIRMMSTLVNCTSRRRARDVGTQQKLRQDVIQSTSGDIGKGLWCA